MDTHDVSGLPENFARIKQQKANLRNALARKGQRPARQPRDPMILQFIWGVNHRSRGNGVDIVTSFVPSPYPPCTTLLCDLSKTMLDDLVLETHHRGKYVLLRCVTPQDRLAAVMAIAEDENGETMMLQMYHQEQAGDTPEDILSEGVVVLVKEPYLKYMANGGYGLRVDHVSDVVFLSPGDDRIPDDWKQASSENRAATWKMKGNEHFNKAKYRAAITAYTQALDCSPTEEERRVITLNRSLAHLRAKSFEAALVDASSETTEKALFRQAQSLYGLRKFRECCEVLKALRLEHPTLNAAKDMLDRAIARLSEQTTGRYNFKDMHDEAAKLRPPHLDRATFIGPVVVKESGVSPGGRGLFTTKAVSAGDLLLCESAFAAAFTDDSGSSSASGAALTVLIDTETDAATMGAQAELLNRIIRKMHLNPSCSKSVTDLHHGAYESVDVDALDGSPVIDSFLVRRIISLNSFGCPNATSQTPKPTTPATKHQFHSCGVWTTASYINHACTSNAHRSFIGDMMIVRAARDLPANTELTWWYHPPVSEPTAYLVQQRPLLKNWGFMCKCAMCRELRDTPESLLEKRKKLRGEMKGLLAPGMGLGVVGRMEALVRALDGTFKRPATEAPRLGVSEMRMGLAAMYARLGRPGESASSALEALAALGFVVEGGGPKGQRLVVREWGLVVHHVVDCWMYLRDAYHLIAPELAEVAEGYGMTAYRVFYGEDGTFEDSYGRVRTF